MVVNILSIYIMWIQTPAKSGMTILLYGVVFHRKLRSLLLAFSEYYELVKLCDRNICET
ncbi:hypothetical protein [Nostoc sp. DedQUE09]|uniref:hypothetical protein n=1 Tax=Nostoc sp. DedQUE09 TaxID=3075394 RepID=UPI002AD45A64|nr:hypothetical protein [Nostoc sp. DedQUE09]MDZ7953953.1 hypothetical protein [Nostoc sp. DedQUE09]